MAEHAKTLRACAVIEGVRMTAGKSVTYAVRNRQGDISMVVEPRKEGIRPLLERIPFLRCVLRLFFCIADFFAGICRSEKMKPHMAEKGNRFEARFATLFRISKERNVARLAVLKMLIVFALFLVVLPEALVYVLRDAEWAGTALLDGSACAARIAGLLITLKIMSRTRVFRRMCKAQDAAGRVVNAYEIYGINLTSEEVRACSAVTTHSNGVFLLTTAIIAMVVYTCIPFPALLARVWMRLLLLFAVAAVWGEIYRLFENAKPGSLKAMVHKPMADLQKLWLRKSDDEMTEVTLCAFNALMRH